MEVRGACPHCGSYHIGEANVAYAYMPVLSWDVNDAGELVPDAVDSDVDTEWQADHVLMDQNEGYQCLDCYEDFGEPVRIDLPSTPAEIAEYKADGGV